VLAQVSDEKAKGASTSSVNRENEEVKSDLDQGTVLWSARLKGV